MPTVSRASGGAHEETGRFPVPADGAPAGAPDRAGPWRGRAGLVIVAATAIGLALRLLLLTRPGFLTSGTVEYDDGVYLGAAIRLLQGELPYRDFAFVQPPGIVILALPFAVVAKVVSAPAGLAAARIVTACASAACVPLAGRLVRHRGAGVTLVTCGFLALYPADVLTARTLLLEPWMNLCCLLAATAAFDRGRLASPRRLAWAGIAVGFAVTVKFWAAVPAAALLGCCLLARDDRWRRARAYLAALVAGFAVPVAALAATAPGAFVHSAIFDQVSRMGSYTSLPARLAYLTGVMDVLDGNGHVNPGAGVHSMLAVGSNGTMVINGIGWLPSAAAAAALAVIAAAYLRRPASRSALEWFALAVAVVSCVAVSLYSAFYYHYPAFPAPWLAICLGAAAGAWGGAAVRLAGRRGGAARKVMAAGAAALVLAVGAQEARQLSTATAQARPAAAGRIIPPGACVFTDQVSFTIAAGRLPSPRPGCPDVIDSFAATLQLSGGVSVPGGAANMPRVTAGWEAILGQARYVWLTQGYQARIPWSAGLRSWFGAHFREVRTFRGYGHSTLYERR